MFEIAKKRLLALSLVCFTLASCSAIHLAPAKPPIDSDTAYLNRQIKLVVVQHLSAFNTRDAVAVLLGYYTTYEVDFPNNFGLRLFSQQDGKWVEIKEHPTIRPERQIVLSPTIPSSYSQIVMFYPELDDPTKEYYIRLYVFGTMKAPGGAKAGCGVC